MRLLLDTHAFLWWLTLDDALTPAARAAIADRGNDVLVSAASAWKIATKHRIGKLPGAGLLMGDLDGVVAAQGFSSLPITVRHGQAAGALPGPHRDPFDRMLIAQSLLDMLGLAWSRTRRCSMATVLCGSGDEARALPLDPAKDSRP